MNPSANNSSDQIPWNSAIATTPESCFIRIAAREDIGSVEIMAVISFGVFEAARRAVEFWTLNARVIANPLKPMTRVRVGELYSDLAHLYIDSPRMDEMGPFREQMISSAHSTVLVVSNGDAMTVLYPRSLTWCDIADSLDVDPRLPFRVWAVRTTTDRVIYSCPLTESLPIDVCGFRRSLAWATCPFVSIGCRIYAVIANRGPVGTLTSSNAERV